MYKFLPIILILILSVVSCKRDVNTLEPASYPVNGEIYLDGFSGGLGYQAFTNSKLDAFQIDKLDRFKGINSMIITVPSQGDPSGWFAGGAFISPPRDLSGFNALTFWAKASQVAQIGLVGFGNDNSGNSIYSAWVNDVIFTTTWQKFIIPIPNPNKLTVESGMFQYAIGADENGNGFNVWFDEVQFEKIGTIAHPQAKLQNQTIYSFVGDTINIGEIVVTASGSNVEVKAMPAYLDFYTDNKEVIAIEDEIIRVIGTGKATITAKLGNLDAIGTITVEVGNMTPAPAPEFPKENVISLFSNLYSNVQVDSWNPNWQYSTTELSDVKIGLEDLKMYTNLNFVGIVFTSQTLNVTEMTHFHMDLWTPDPVALPAAFRIELVDFGADNAYGGGDDSSHMFVINTNTVPKLVKDEWINIDIPLSKFTGLKSKKNIAQIVFSSADNQFPNTIYIDNVLFHK